MAKSRVAKLFHFAKTINSKSVAAVGPTKTTKICSNVTQLHSLYRYIQTFSLLASNLCLYIWWLESIIQIQMFLYFLVCIFNNYWMINFKINVLFYKEASFIAVYRSFKRHSDVPQLSYIVYRKKALMLFLFKVNGRKYWKISKPCRKYSCSKIDKNHPNR